MNNPNKKRLRRTMMFLNAQKPGLIKDPYIYKADSLMLDLEDARREPEGCRPLQPVSRPEDRGLPRCRAGRPYQRSGHHLLA